MYGSVIIHMVCDTYVEVMDTYRFNFCFLLFLFCNSYIAVFFWIVLIYPSAFERSILCSFVPSLLHSFTWLVLVTLPIAAIYWDDATYFFDLHRAKLMTCLCILMFVCLTGLVFGIRANNRIQMAKRLHNQTTPVYHQETHTNISRVIKILFLLVTLSVAALTVQVVYKLNICNVCFSYLTTCYLQ